MFTTKATTQMATAPTPRLNMMTTGSPLGGESCVPRASSAVAKAAVERGTEGCDWNRVSATPRKYRHQTV
ncbi:hypothetical protein C7456_103117 [Fulvimonas soli]|uniref:Uncharacterized protein n=1 Tax=Fulvimonas soli TaxID=155197 RepID=A0A316INB8_9GAMM|nr:hypothetical protein C7456_103117 [Fulvimonas soli]